MSQVKSSTSWYNSVSRKGSALYAGSISFQELFDKLGKSFRLGRRSVTEKGQLHGVFTKSDRFLERSGRAACSGCRRYCWIVIPGI